MRPKPQAPKESEVPGHGASGKRKRIEHPAFGQIGASRVQGSTPLYGSDFIHHNWIVVRIWGSATDRDLSRDWRHTTEHLIEVALSEAQWATFLSTLNMGEGVPCTLRTVNGELIPDIALPRGETDEFVKEMRKHSKDAQERLTKLMDAVESGELKGKRALLQELHRLRNEFGPNIEFVAESFDKHVEDQIETAKVEVAAYIDSVIHRAGLQGLQDGGAPIELPGSAQKKLNPTTRGETE